MGMIWRSILQTVTSVLVDTKDWSRSVGKTLPIDLVWESKPLFPLQFESSEQPLGTQNRQM